MNLFRTNEQGGIITGFILRILLGLAVTIGLFYEGGAVIFSKVQADSIAVEASAKAAEEFGRSGSTAKATEVAEEITKRRGAELITLEVLEGEVELSATVRVRAKTLVFHRFDATRRFTVSKATHKGRVP